MTHRIARLVVTAMVAPVVIAITGSVLQLLWLPQLPAEVAVHWSPTGVDDTRPAWSLVVLTLVLGIGLPALLGIPAIAGARRSGVTWIIRLLGALSPAVVTMVVVAVTWSVAVQRGLADAHDAPSIGPALLLSAGIAIAVGVLAWFALPRHVRPDHTDGQPETMRLVAGERAVWIGSARSSPAVFAVIGTVLLVVAAVAVLGVVLTDGRGWPILFAPVVLSVVIVGTLSWKVRVDDDGLAVRGMLGWPVFRVRPAELEGATTRNVTALGDFGGWGIRFGPSHALGIITRSGEALVAHRTGDRELVVTVDDAETAASLLAGYARSRSS